MKPLTLTLRLGAYAAAKGEEAARHTSARRLRVFDMLFSLKCFRALG